MFTELPTPTPEPVLTRTLVPIATPAEVPVLLFLPIPTPPARILLEIPIATEVEELVAVLSLPIAVPLYLASLS